MADTLSAEVEGLFDLPEGREEQAPQVEAQAEQAQEAAPQEPEPESPVEVSEEQPQQQEQQKEAHHVPLATFLDEKLARRDAERRAKELEAQIAAAQKPQEPEVVPDPYEDPKGYDQYVLNQVDRQAFGLRAEMSGRFAEQKFGKETVEAAIQWAQEQGKVDPFLGQRVQLSQSPVEFVVEQYQREQFFKQYGSDPSALANLAASQATATAAPPQMAAPAATPKVAPPRSLATAPSTGAGHQSVPAGSVLDSVKFNLD